MDACVFSDDDRRFMAEAMKEARAAYDEGEIPVGAVVVSDGMVIARAHNQTERLHDVTAHAEMLALTAAEEYVGGKYLNDCTMYVTLEPCTMCGGAAGWTQLGRLVYAASDPKRGYTSLVGQVLHPRTSVASGLMADEAEALLKQFFRERRQ